MMQRDDGLAALLRLRPMQNTRHKIFVSYHHDNDQFNKDQFEALFHNHHNIVISKSVQIGDIDSNLKTETIRQKIRDEYLSDSTVTVVLIGRQTWQRKHVDWEIGSSIRNTEKNPRSGLLGILLPTYRPMTNTPNGIKSTIPPRLSKNIDCGYATIHNWSDDPVSVQKWIHDAFERSKTKRPDNSYRSFQQPKRCRLVLSGV